MWVKICANTSLEDTLRAAELGADAVGFVFAPSPRQMRPAEVRPISDALPPGLERVGVFISGSAAEIAEAAKAAGLTAVQLHGGLDLDLAQALREKLQAGVSLIHSVHWTVGEDDGSAERVARQLALIRAYGLAERVLVDTRVGKTAGGTGIAFPWERARPVLQSQPGLRVIVAGGLGPETVADAIAQLKPWGIDVASGAERVPGRKDFGKLERFIRNARAAS